MYTICELAEFGPEPDRLSAWPYIGIICVRTTNFQPTNSFPYVERFQQRAKADWWGSKDLHVDPACETVNTRLKMSFSRQDFLHFRISKSKWLYSGVFCCVQAFCEAELRFLLLFLGGKPPNPQGPLRGGLW
jgi:hypothetical protein